MSSNIFRRHSDKNLHFPLGTSSLSDLIFFFSEVETTSRHIFPSANLHCLPLGDPRNLCASASIRLLPTHSLNQSELFPRLVFQIRSKTIERLAKLQLNYFFFCFVWFFFNDAKYQILERRF